MTVSGRCECGSVRFEVKGELPSPVACHCKMCRQSSGHFWASTGFRRERLTMNHESGLEWYQSSENVRRGFCKDCGSSLFFDEVDGPWISVSMGSLDSPSNATLSGHIFVANKGDYYTIGDSLPQREYSK